MSPSSARSARKCRQKQTHIDLLSIRQPQMDSLQPWHSKSQLSSPPQVMAARLLLAFIFIASSGGMVGATTANSQPQIVSAGSPVCRILQGMGWDGHTALSSPGGIPKSQGRMALIHLSHSKLFFSGSIPNQSPVNPQLAGCTNGSGTGEYFLGLILSLPQIGPQVSLVCARGCGRSELKPAELSSCGFEAGGEHFHGLEGVSRQ